MEKEKLPDGAGLPPTRRFAPFFPSSSSSSSCQQAPTQTTTSFSHDLSGMPDNPPKNMRHRRAHSEILTLPDDISFNSDLGVVEGGPSFSDEAEDDMFMMYMDMDKVNTFSPGFQVGEDSSGSVVPRPRHQHSQSMDGTSTIKTEMLVDGGGGSEEVLPADARKGISAAKLAELALVDPKRAKRIWANRQSAARSKERKIRYIADLERKVQMLQTEASSLSAQLNLLQRDTTGLTTENSELKLRLQTTEQQVHLQDALNETLKDEIQHLKMLTGQTMSNGGAMMNFPTSFAGSQPFYPNNQAMLSLLTAQQFQQLQIHSQQKQQQQQHHQFQHHQLHQLQQQQEPVLTQHAGDFKIRPAMPFSKDNTSDPKSGASKD